MKAHGYSRYVATAFVAVVLGGTALARAQSDPQPQNRPQRRPLPADQLGSDRPQGFPGGAQFNRFPAIYERLTAVLTDEQQASLRDAMAGQRDKIRELEEKIRDARRETFDAGLTGKFDEGALRKRLQAVADLEIEMTVLRAKAFSQIQPPLSAGQIEKLKSPAMPAGDDNAGNQPRRRPNIPRDENGLPLRGAPGAAPNPDNPPKPNQP